MAPYRSFPAVSGEQWWKVQKQSAAKIMILDSIAGKKDIFFIPHSFSLFFTDI
ncbi:hypothetical protein BOVA713_5231 [Bacteroides ovatus]|jgi:hypothetical protein|nr:hypothetical protein BOVA713_5231 [Bacteroides ovatus]